MVLLGINAYSWYKLGHLSTFWYLTMRFGAFCTNLHVLVQFDSLKKNGTNCYFQGKKLYFFDKDRD